MNLLKETLEALAEAGKTIDDVVWVGCNAFEIPIDLFMKLSNREYDNSYGSPEVAIDLKVVGDGWMLQRGEYDGLEWWDFITIPERPKECKNVNRVIVNENETGWECLEKFTV